MRRYLIFTLSFLALYTAGLTTAKAQLFDDLEKRENVSTGGWVVGVDIGGMLAFYSASPEFSAGQSFISGGSYLAPGFHLGGVVLRSLDGFKLGGAVAFQRFSGSDDVVSYQGTGPSADEPDLDVFREISLNAVNISARGEVALMSSVEGGLFMVVDLGLAILSGDYPGDSVSPPFRGGFGFGYEIRLTDKTNLQLEIMANLMRFQNQWEQREVTHFVYSSVFSAGLRC